MRVALVTKYGTIESIDKTMPFYGMLATRGQVDVKFGTSYYGELPVITFDSKYLHKNNMIIIVNDQQYVLTNMMLSMMTFDENECYKLAENVVIHRNHGYLGLYHIAVNNNIKEIKGFRFIPSESFLNLKPRMQYLTSFVIERSVQCEINFDKLGKLKYTTVDELKHVHIDIPTMCIESTLRDTIIYTTPNWNKYIFNFKDSTICCDFDDRDLILLPDTPIHFEYTSERNR